MLSQKAKYALRALLALAEAEGGEPMHISDIAAHRNLPRKFLEAILLELKHHGLVHSRRGRNGGYSLARPAAEISFGQVIRIIDGPMAPLPCLSRMAYRRCDDCDDEKSCAIRRVFAVTHELTARMLDETTLADALASGSAATGSAMLLSDGRPDQKIA